MSETIVNWQEEHLQWQADGSKGTFMAWLLLESMVLAEKNMAKTAGRDAAHKKFFDDLAVATNNWTEMKITMQINGVDVPAQQTLDEINKQLDQLILDKAVKIVKEKTSLGELMNALEKGQQFIMDELRKLGALVE